MLIDKNTVEADNQMINSGTLSHIGSPTAARRILIVGNSITRHGPKAEIGWERDWGMAASAPERDYVHRLFAMLKADGQDVLFRIKQCAYYERNFRKEGILAEYDGERAFDPHVLIFRIGENVAKEERPLFKDKMRDFVDHICPNGKVIFTTCFWKNPVIDTAIREIAAERGEECVDICFSADEANMALDLFRHRGVGLHPGDVGMERIAEAIFQKLKK